MRHLIPGTALLCGTLLSPCGANAQTVLDWPLLLEARPGVLVDGAGAVLVNPAGVVELDARAEALVSDLETPAAMGLRALTIAGAVRILDGWSLAAAYRHLDVGDMLRTDGPPLGSDAAPLPTLVVAEDVYSVGVAHRRGALALGLAGRVDTPADALGGDDVWTGTAGATWTPPLPFGTLRLAAALEIDSDDADFAAAAELAAPLLLDEQLRLGLGYGTTLESPLGAEHAIIATGDWRRFAELQVGASAQPGADGTRWVPLVAGIIRLGRYHLGIVREHLPNGFGAAMHYRLSIAF